MSATTERTSHVAAIEAGSPRQRRAIRLRTGLSIAAITALSAAHTAPWLRRIVAEELGMDEAEIYPEWRGGR